MTFFEGSLIPARNIEDVLVAVQQELITDVAAKGDATLIAKPLTEHSMKYGAPGCWFSIQGSSGPPGRFTYGVLLEAIERLWRFLPSYSSVMYAEVFDGLDGRGEWIGSILFEGHAPAPRAGSTNP